MSPSKTVCKTYAGHTVLDGINLHRDPAEKLSPCSGAAAQAKSVLLRLIIGLETPDSGSIHIHGQDIGLAMDRMGRDQEEMGLLFQHAALYDSLTVAENVAFPLRTSPETCPDPSVATG